MKLHFPKYAIVPLISMLLMNTITYFITPILTNHLFHYTFETKLDSIIPFVPAFIIPYILAYLQWIIGYVAVAYTSRDYCYKIYFGEIIAKLLVLNFFIFVPTTMHRPEFIGNDPFTHIITSLYSIDSPTNLFPSIHCLESWVCFRAALNRKYYKPPYAIIMGIMTLLVFLSTVFIKQHVIADMAGAILVAEFGFFAAKRIPFLKIKND